MGDAMDEDVLIHGKPLIDEFTCPVCFELIDECASTPCGHSFCKACLDECLNRRKTCPTCTSPVDVKKVLPNKHLDRILHVLQDQKAKADKTHFEKLLAGSAPSSAPHSASKDANSSSIQLVFQKHLMRGLGSYEEYLKKLKSAAEARAAELTADYDRRVAKAKKEGAEASELRTLKAHHQSTLEKISASYAASEKQLQDEYEAFLTQNLVNPTFLPVQVIVSIEATGVRYPYVLEPTSTLEDVKKFLLTKPASAQAPDLMTRISSRRNPFVLRPPFSHPNDASPKSSPMKSIAKEDVKLDQKYAPLTQTYQVFPGSQIVMLGAPYMKLQTKECFKSTFVPDDEETHKCAFMKCETCSKNWICKHCAQVCHAGHTLTLHVAEQVWKTPCCYCTKTKLCTLSQKH